MITQLKLYGDHLLSVTNKNYKKLKKGSKLYYDRGSTAFRGPFLFTKHSKGPILEMKGKDVGYGTVYNFEISVSSLSKNVLYYITSNSTKTERKGKKGKTKRKSRRKRKTRKRKRKYTKRKTRK